MIPTTAPDITILRLQRFISEDPLVILNRPLAPRTESHDIRIGRVGQRFRQLSGD
jgi:hypothetical protein